MADWEMIGKPTKPGEAKLKAPKSEEEWEAIGKPARTVGSSLKGGALAAGDFASQVVSMIPAGITGIGAGLYEGIKSGSLDQGIDAATNQINRVSKSIMPSTYIDSHPQDREFADKVLGYPAELGGEAMRGVVGLSKAIGHRSVDAGADYLRHPESDPLASAAADTAGMVAGYGIAGRAMGRGMDAATIRGYERPQAAGEARFQIPEIGRKAEIPTSTDPTAPVYRTRKEEAAARKKDKKAGKGEWEPIGTQLALRGEEVVPKEDTTGLKVDGEAAGLQPPGQRPLAPLMRNNRTGEKIPVPGEPKVSEGAIDFGLPENAVYGPRTAPIEKATEGRQQLTKSREEIQAREQAIEDAKPDLDKPLEYDLTLDEQTAARQRADLDVPRAAEDFSLKLEKAEKDTHLKNKVKELENLEREIKEAERQAGQEAAETSRVRQGEVDRTKVGKERTAETDRLIEERRKKRDKVKEQITSRLLNRHPDIDIRVNIDEHGRPNLSLVESSMDHRREPTEYGGFDKSLTRSLVDSIEFTRDKITREIERTERPNMQRSPEVEPQPRAFEKSMGNKQRGAVNPEVFREGFEKIKEVAEKGIQLVAKHVGFGKEHPGTLQIMAKNTKGDIIGSVLFSPEDFRSMPLNEKTDLYSMDTAVAPEWRNKGVPHEIYQFAAELGNDVVPSKARSKDGRAMWESFEKRGLSNKGRINRQRGASDFGITGALGKLLSKARTAEQMRADLGYGEQTPAPKRSKTHREVLDAVLPSETRSIDQFVEETSPNWNSFRDIPGTILNKIIQPNSVGALSQKYNPFIRWMSAKLDSIDRKIRMEKEDAKWGTGWKQGLRGWEKRTKKTDDGARTILDRLKLPEADKVRETLVHFSDGKELISSGLERPTEQMLRDRGLNDTQIKAVNAIYDVFDKLLDRANTLLKSLGMSTIKKRPGFFPSVWMGDYRIFIKDQEGKVLTAFGANTRREMNQIVKDMQSRHPEYKISTDEVGRNKYKMNDTNAFRLALEMLDKDSPEAKILEATYKDVVAHRGFKTHALEKKGAGGFMGTKEGITGVREMGEAIDIYIDKAYNFIGELEKKTALAELKQKFAERDQRIPSKFENTNEYLNDMVANSTGAVKNQLEFIDNFLEATGRKTGLGSTAAKRAIGNVSGLAGVFWLSTVKFLEMGMVQPLYNLAKLRELKINLEDTHSITGSMLQGYGQAFVPKMQTAETKAAMSWAKKNGFIDAKVIDLMGVQLNKSIWAKKIMGEVPKHTLGWWEQEVVRTPTFLAYNHMLKDVIKNDKERWEAAGALTDKYMVDYSRTQSPSVYSKLGIVGDAARPLKQYSHGYTGQLAEYTARAVHDKQYSPLATFLGTQWALAGLKGMVGITAATTAINTINQYTNSDIPTPEELMIGSGMSDLVTFGPLSTITGQDLTGSLGAPDPSSMTALPGVDFAGKAIKEGVSYGSKLAQGLDTPQDEMSLLQSVSPRLATGFIEQAYTEPGQGVPNTKGRPGISDLSPRTESEWNVRKITSARPLREASEAAGIRAYKGKGKRLQEQKTLIMNKLLTDVVAGKGISPELADKWVKAGGDPREWSPAIKKYLLDKNLTFANREIMKLKGLSGAEKAERMEKFRVGMERLSAEDLAEVAHQLHQ